MSDTIIGAKRRRGTVRGRLTRIERDITTLETKEGLTPVDQRKVKRLKEQVKETDREYEERHVQVLDFIKEEDKETLDSEEAIFEKHVDRVSDILERLEQLEEPAITTEPVPIPTPSLDDTQPVARSITEAEHLDRRLNQVHDSLTEVKKVVYAKGLDSCSLEGHEEVVRSLSDDVQEIKRDMLLIEDYDSLAKTAVSLERASFEIRVAIKRQLKEINAESCVSKETGLSGLKLLKLSVPTFDGRVLNWKIFWE